MLDVANNPCKMKYVIIVANDNDIWITLFRLMSEINHFSLKIHIYDLFQTCCIMHNVLKTRNYKKPTLHCFNDVNNVITKSCIYIFPHVKITLWKRSFGPKFTKMFYAVKHKYHQ